MNVIRWQMACWGLALTVGCQPSAPVETVATTEAEAESAPQDAKQVAIAAKDALAAQLSSRLLAAIGAGGPVAAIKVCRQEAGPIAKSVGEQHGVTIGRTSHKLRNPGNAPPEWVAPLIALPVEDPQFVDLDDGATGALLPIRLQAQCIACHGTPDRMADDVRAQLAESYPDDRATGFEVGDLRGWFWIEVPAR